jgi:hypothetical protein
MQIATTRTNAGHGNGVASRSLRLRRTPGSSPGRFIGLVELIALLASARRWNRWAVVYRITAVVLRRSRFVRRLALAATVIAVGMLATFALLATLVAHTL